jgi:uncharacterized membrane protein
VDIPIPQAITENQQQEQNTKLITKIFSEILLKVALLALIILMSMYVENYKLVANIERAAKYRTRSRLRNLIKI